MNEIEIKIALRTDQDVKNAFELCRSVCNVEPEVTSQRDIYFDTRDESLRGQDFVVRLRTVGNRTKLALKSPRRFSHGSISNRIELEFTVAETEVREQLRTSDLQAVAEIEKRRTEFVAEQATVAIDELPFIGAFIEIEARSAELVETMTSKLELTRSNSTPENYTELLERFLSSNGLPIRPNLKVTFEAEASWQQSRPR